MRRVCQGWYDNLGHHRGRAVMHHLWVVPYGARCQYNGFDVCALVGTRVGRLQVPLVFLSATRPAGGAKQ